MTGERTEDDHVFEVVIVGDLDVSERIETRLLGVTPGRPAHSGPSSGRIPRMSFRQVSEHDEQGLRTAMDADGVVICSAVPDRWIATLIEQDTPLMVEPWAISHRTANRLCEALATDTSPRVVPAMPHRFLEESLAAGSLLSGGYLGRLVFARFGLDPTRLTCAGTIAMELDGSAGPDILDVAASVVDLTVGWFRRPVIDVYAQRRSGGSPGSMRHHLTITTRFAGGGTSIGEINLAEDHQPAGLREILLQGTTGAANVPWDAYPTMVESDGHVRALAGPAREAAVQRMLAAWIDGPASGRSPIADLLGQVDLREAIDRSLHDRQPVRVPALPEAPKEHL